METVNAVHQPSKVLCTAPDPKDILSQISSLGNAKEENL